jgi:hypothetical protein
MLIAVDGTVAFHAADCAWFQPAALAPRVVDLFRQGLADSGRLWRTFYDWQAPPTADQFRDVLTRAGALTWFGFDEISRAPMAFFWLDPCGAMARINFALMPDCTGRRALRVGREVTDLILEYGYGAGLRALMGETPAANAPAVKYAKASGMRLVGVIPGGCWMAESGDFCGRVITCKTLED